MRIAIDATAIPRHRAGAGTYTYNLVQALARIACDGQFIVFARPGILPVTVARENNLRVVPVPLSSRLQRLLWEQTLLPTYLNRWKIDLLHSPHHTIPIAAATCRRVVTFHDVTFFLIPQRYPPLRGLYFRQVSRLAAHVADAIIAVSQTVRADIQRTLRIPATKVHVVPEAAGAEFRPLPPEQTATVAATYGLPPRFILSVGTLEPGKNRGTLIHAFARLKQQRLEHKLVIVGQKGWMYETLLPLVQRLGLQEDVIFTGYVPQEDLPAVYNLADLFVFPSLYEGFGLPPLEAMACGVPAVAANRSAIPEVVGDAAVLVDPRSPDCLAEAMLAVLTDEHLRRDLQQRGQERAQQFSWEETARKTMEVYGSVLREHRR